MKQGMIFHQYIWIINTLRKSDGLTFEELKQKWVEDRVANGNVLQRSSFNRHREAILSMFGIVIDCNLQTYKYYIGNEEVLQDDSIEQWLFSTLTVHGVLEDSGAVKDRVVLENVPLGLEYLNTIVKAIKTNHRLRIGYRKFGTEGYVKTVCPYALKLFHQRWYLLGKNEEEQMRVYALDRMNEATLLDEVFEMPESFSAQAYFADYFGVLTDGTQMEHVVVRAYNRTRDYLRTLPLHHSQHVVAAGADYTDFAFDIRPTADFLGELMSYGSGVEIISPVNVREKMRLLILEVLKRY